MFSDSNAAIYLQIIMHLIHANNVTIIHNVDECLQPNRNKRPIRQRTIELSVNGLSWPVIMSVCLCTVNSFEKFINETIVSEDWIHR